MSAIRVLLVDDHKLFRAGIRSLLQTVSGIEVVAEAEDGREALRLIEAYRPDVVLMDIMMPGMDGYEAMRAIRKNRRYKHVPMIAVTAKAMRGDREKCIEAGASDYITKPVDVDQLLSLLRVWLFK